MKELLLDQPLNAKNMMRVLQLDQPLNDNHDEGIAIRPTPK
jgi:hypothetical protein